MKKSVNRNSSISVQLKYLWWIYISEAKSTAVFLINLTDSGVGEQKHLLPFILNVFAQNISWPTELEFDRWIDRFTTTISPGVTRESSECRSLALTQVWDPLQMELLDCRRWKSDFTALVPEDVFSRAAVYLLLTFNRRSRSLLCCI